MSATIDTNDTDDTEAQAEPTAARKPHRPATGLPRSTESRRGSAVVSALLHALLIFLIAVPIASSHEGVVEERAQGAGGAGPAGGGGGGKQGTGGVRERVAYAQVSPPPVAVVPAPTVTPPVVPPPTPVVPPPTPEVKPQPQVELPPAQVTPKVDATKVESIAPIAGTGGGSGRDGSAGNGPGRGGGTGSGIGTGRGSGVGAGTGGGEQVNYAPAPIELFIPPLPMPAKVRGFHLIAEYDVDSTGKVLDFKFTPTRDGGYNKRLEEVLKSFKFRPGTRPDGTPIRMKAQIIYDF